MNAESFDCWTRLQWEDCGVGKRDKCAQEACRGKLSGRRSGIERGYRRVDKLAGGVELLLCRFTLPVFCLTDLKAMADKWVRGGALQRALAGYGSPKCAAMLTLSSAQAVWRFGRRSSSLNRAWRPPRARVQAIGSPPTTQNIGRKVSVDLPPRTLQERQFKVKHQTTSWTYGVRVYGCLRITICMRYSFNIIMCPYKQNFHAPPSVLWIFTWILHDSGLGKRQRRSSFPAVSPELPWPSVPIVRPQLHRKFAARPR